jgi:hypothetical protein
MCLGYTSASDIICISDTTCVLDMKHVFYFSTTSVPNIFRSDKYLVTYVSVKLDKQGNSCRKQLKNRRMPVLKYTNIQRNRNRFGV